jgi:uncharacterized protein YcbX
MEPVTTVGRVCEIVRYPVKSMAGVATESAFLGWHGLDGDRRVAFRRVTDESGFPFLTASRLPELIRYRPVLSDDPTEIVATHVRTPSGTKLELRSPELLEELAGRVGSGLELHHFRNGIFDEAAVSLICLATVARIGQEANIELDRRRFRANIVVASDDEGPFVEDTWVGRTLRFGDVNTGPAVNVILRDERCMMINLDPDTAQQNPQVMKAVVRLNDNCAGVYATVVRRGLIRVGDPIHVART